MKMKTLKLWVHKKKLTDKQSEDIILNSKDCPELVIGDVVEVYHPEEEFSRLLLQVTTLPDDFQPKDHVISIEQSIATAFQLKTYQNVIVNKVDKKLVTVDLAEVAFRDQYYSRSDMHRLRNSMVGTCVYLNKKIEYSEMRGQVYELWCRGDKVTCGVIADDTRVVYRSSTAVVQIFIQMSSEMWDFDINGDLYFEKAVNGFLTDLYAKWKEQTCLHDVTIVMFSRTFYEAQSRDEFPAYMQDCLQQDYVGRFYEDFYRVVVQNERYDEWTGTIKQLRKIFYEYPERVLKYHQRRGHKVPKAYNSTAAQGNFLETLNMTLNLFEKYYYDRNFDRTGKVSVVITPGAGVFEVDRELTNITKQRTIDCGIGSDLVCMGEQPLHAAPLFKFHSKNHSTMPEVGDDYNIPHWMNHSFYISKNQIQFYSNRTFVPRIKIPPEIFDKKKQKEAVVDQDLSYNNDDDNFPFVDYDEYDAQVFKLASRNPPVLSYGKSGTRHGADRHSRRWQKPLTFQEAKLRHQPRKRTISDDVSALPVEKPSPSGTLAVSIPSVSSSGTDDISASYPVLERIMSESTESEYSLGIRPVVGSAGSPVSSRKFMTNYKRHRALINPFAPSRLQFKTTSNRRRWVHAFPTDPHGVAVQTHHVHSYSYHDNHSDDDLDLCELTPQAIQAAQMAVKARKEHISFKSSEPPDLNISDDFTSFKESPSRKSYIQDANRSIGALPGRDSRHLQQQRSFMWGPTGEQEWSPELTTGQDWRPLDDVETRKAESRLIKPILTADYENTQSFCAGISVDWKSLTMPASLPITTDYFPDNSSLQNDYLLAEYSLSPVDANSDYYMNPPQTDIEKYYRRQPLATKQLFEELVSQRLSQGFQVIVLSKCCGPSHVHHNHGYSTSTSGRSHMLSSSPHIMGTHMAGLMRARPREEQVEEVHLSIGRIFHKLQLSGPTITVTRYRPRHPSASLTYNYRYRFQAPDSYNYDVSWSEFYNEKLENYNWNYLDQYICTRGEGDYGLMDSLKFWRSRFFVLPSSNTATKKIIDGSRRCDIYEDKACSDLRTLVTGFTKYLETLNKMKRTAVTRTTNCKHKEFLDKNPQGIPMPDTRPDEDVLSVASSSEKVVSWMLDPECGIPMLPKQNGLPTQCFISAEIVDWCYYHVKGIMGIKTAMDLMQRLLDEGYIIHASGSSTHKMVYGFYLYTFRDKEPVPFNPLFQNEWCEVAFVPPTDSVGPSYVNFSLDGEGEGNPSGDPTMPHHDWRKQTGLDRNGQTWAQQSGSSPEVAKTSLPKATLLHKYVNVDVDPQQKSDRLEWATARYHSYYSPLCGFELQVQWMVSTGQVLGDLINNWARKASSCGFHLLPVPCDPFALPSAVDSDPLRGPIFVPLNINCLEDGQGLFLDFDEDTRQAKMLHLQEAIIRRYGFMPSTVQVGKDKVLFKHEESRVAEDYHQYVHCTGGMFVIIEDTKLPISSPAPKEKPLQKQCKHDSMVNLSMFRSTSAEDTNKKFKKSSSFGFGKKSSAEMRKDYIARQTSQITMESLEPEVEIGFLWSWNFMSSKKWRSPNTGDEHFQDTVLQDFRDFCSDKESRLQEFWKQYGEENIV